MSASQEVQGAAYGGLTGSVRYSETLGRFWAARGPYVTSPTTRTMRGGRRRPGGAGGTLASSSVTWG